MKVLVPSETDAGLDSERSGHFGHANYFTVVDIENNEIVSVSSVKNVDHDEFGCGGVIEYALSQNPDALITVGMGRPPLSRFNDAGVKVYSERVSPIVRDAINNLINGNCDEMSLEDACNHH